MVYNLCAEPERQYKSKVFHGNGVCVCVCVFAMIRYARRIDASIVVDLVANFQFYDHNAPPLRMMPAFCEHAGKFLAEDPLNIVAIHCKAGKV
jgi:hypothetical protein